MNKEEAIEAYKQAIRINPDDAEAHNNLGYAYCSLGGTDMSKKAIEAWKQAIRIDPDDVEAHNNLAYAYGNLRMYKEAIEAWKQAIRIDPDNMEAHVNLNFAYDNSGMHKEAKESYKQAIRINPDFDFKKSFDCSFDKLGVYSGVYPEAIRVSHVIFNEKRHREYKERFKNMSDEQLIDAYNSQVGNPGWGYARMLLLSALHDEIENRNYDYSDIGDKDKQELFNLGKRVKLIGKKIVIDEK